MLTYRLGANVLQSRDLGLACAAIFGLMAATIRTYSMLWSEPLFTALIVCALLLLVRAAQQGRLSLVFLAAILTSFATTVRYMGFSLIPIVSLAAYAVATGRSRLARLALAAVAGAVATIGALGVASTQQAGGSTPFGDRFAAGIGIPHLVGASFAILGEYLIPRHQLIGFLLPAAIALGIPLALLLSYGLLRAALQKSTPILLLSSYVAVYWLALWASEILLGVDPANERMLEPALPAMTVVIIFAVQQMMGRQKFSAHHSRHSFTIRLVISIAAIAAISSIAQNIHFVATSARNGIEMNTSTYRDSRLTSAVRDLPEGAGVASNHAALTYWVSRRVPVSLIPVGGYYQPGPAVRTLTAEFEQSIRSGRVSYVVLWHDSPPPLVSIESLRGDGYTADLVSTADEGEIWHVFRQQ